MVENKLKDNAFSLKSLDNPYDGDLGKGIAYDDFETKVLDPYQDGLSSPLVLNLYRTTSKRLADCLELKPGQKVLDVGSGTGISTLELILRNPETSVLGLEVSEGMLIVAKYKFHQASQEDLGIIEKVKGDSLLKYWGEFREESKPYKEKVKFVKGDIQTFDIEPLSISHIVGNQSFHWTDLEKTFAQIRKLLKNDGVVTFNTSSHFYENGGYPNDLYDFRLNEIFRYVVEKVNEKVKIRTDFYNLSKPKHNLSTFKKIALENGFKLEEIASHLIKFDLSILAHYHIPATIRQLNESKVDESVLDAITMEVVSQAIKDPKVLGDISRRYAINTTFRMTKI